MRAQAKRGSHEEEEESAFVSMTDMTVGFLFIMMILLAFFASQMRDSDSVSRDLYEQVLSENDRLKRKLADVRRERDDLVEQRDQLQMELADVQVKLAAATTERDRLKQNLIEANSKIESLAQEVRSLRDRLAELLERIRMLEELVAEKDREIQQLKEDLAKLEKNPLEAYLARVALERRDILRRLRDAIRADFPELQVELSKESDALRFQGEGLFASGRWMLTRDKRGIVERLAERLDEVLPCFTLGEDTKYSVDCNPGYVMVEAVQIEGHTDNVGSDRFNRELSANRANATFFVMTEAAPDIMEHRNLKGQPVLSVAAYGPDRPVTTNETPAGRATNRRIDLRFIMITPQDTEGIEAIRTAFRAFTGRRE